VVIGGDNVGVARLVEQGKAIAGALGGGGLQVEQLPSFLLILDEALTHKVEHPCSKAAPRLRREVTAHKVEQRLVHAVQTDGAKMVGPIRAEPLLDILQIMAGVGVQAAFSKVFNDAPLDQQGVARHVHQVCHPRQEIILVLGQIADARHVERHHADAARQGVRAKQPAATSAQLLVAQPQAATHGTHVLGVQVRVHKVGKVGNAILGRHLPHRLQVGVVPVKVGGNVVGRNGEGEHPPVRIPFQHQLGEGAVQEVHLWLKVLVGLQAGHSPNDDVLVRQRLGHHQVHRQVGERRLKADARRHIHVKDKLLQRLAHFFGREPVEANKGSQVGIKAGKGHRAG